MQSIPPQNSTVQLPIPRRTALWVEQGEEKCLDIAGVEVVF
uniref:Uncharacterized protein n=1 Tax=Arundo donax TaxID=35708 RepID=A0A0A9BBN2_ARUDO